MPAEPDPVVRAAGQSESGVAVPTEAASARHAAADPAGSATAPGGPRSPGELFAAFTLLALQGFGGVLAVAQRVLCENRRWLTHAEFVELLAVSQMLPGPNICNLALMVGDRHYGWRGAIAALAGMLTVPLLIVLALTVAYAQFAQVPQVAGALKGMGAVAAGMIAGSAARLAATLASNPMGPRDCAVLGVAAFAMVAWLRLPLPWVMAGVGGAAVAWAWRALRAADARRARSAGGGRG